MPPFQLDLYGLFAGAGSLKFYDGHFNGKHNPSLGFEIEEDLREQVWKKTDFIEIYTNFASPLVKFIKLLNIKITF